MNKQDQDELKKELSMFWQAIGDAALTPNTDVFGRSEPLYRLEGRNRLAHSLVCQAHRNLHTAVSDAVSHVCRPIDIRDVSGKAIAEFGERYCLKLLEQMLLQEETVEKAKKLAQESLQG
jgi:hypothetical protein